jgi:hypothetical protein
MQRRTMKLLLSMPPRSLKHLLSDMENEIENFTELHDDFQLTDQEKTTDSSDMTKFYETYNAKLRVVGYYAICILVLLGCYACMFISPFQDKKESQNLAVLLEYSGQRSAYAYQISTFALEWTVNDEITWPDIEHIKAGYLQEIEHLKKLQDTVTHGDDKKGLIGTNTLIEWMEELKENLKDQKICAVHKKNGECVSDRSMHEYLGITEGNETSYDHGSNNSLYIFVDDIYRNFN